MADLEQYTSLITNEHADKPKFIGTVELSVAPFVDMQNVLFGMMGGDFDIDTAVGVQLDQIGLWVGITRNVKAPLTGVYFSFDIVGLGFDQGIWKGPFDPATGVVVLDDDTYRTLLYAKIAANNWDGTMEGSKAVLDLIFNNGTVAFIEDNQDMSMNLVITGTPPTPIVLALLTGGYINIKPEGVRINVYVVPTIPGPVFGFDSNNDLIAGFDTGSWGKIITA